LSKYLHLHWLKTDHKLKSTKKIEPLPFFCKKWSCCRTRADEKSENYDMFKEDEREELIYKVEKLKYKEISFFSGKN